MAADSALSKLHGVSGERRTERLRQAVEAIADARAHLHMTQTRQNLDRALTAARERSSPELTRSQISTRAGQERFIDDELSIVRLERKRTELRRYILHTRPRIESCEFIVSAHQTELVIEELESELHLYRATSGSSLPRKKKKKLRRRAREGTWLRVLGTSMAVADVVASTCTPIASPVAVASMTLGIAGVAGPRVLEAYLRREGLEESPPKVDEEE